ncbi:MAG: RNA pseudouridine synthase [Syntrophobacteraceae bacterium]|jgi:RluA family pseudouridine synthase
MHDTDPLVTMTHEDEALRIPILAFGKGWLAVDKPAGITIHNESGRDLCSLASAFIQKETAIRTRLGMDRDFGVNPVHRLDKETSGVVLLAVNREMFRFFSNQFESRQVKKRYVAILHGMLENPLEDDPWGTWGWPLAKTAGGRHNPEGAGQRQDSRTLYRVLDHSQHYTMVEIELLSGRTHQIRRHAKLSGHPVVGDARYGTARAINYIKRNCGFDRLALHARSLAIRLPGGKEPQTIEAPSIPGKMRDLFQNDMAARE